MTKPKPQPTVTVTVTGARRGVRRVIIDDWVFPVGEPVAGVPARISQALEQRDDLTLETGPDSGRSDPTPAALEADPQ